MIFNEVLVMTDTMDHTLVNPNQLHHFGAIVDDNPYGEEPMRILSPGGEWQIPLLSEGTTIFANTWHPTESDLQTLEHVEYSSPHPWDPHQVAFPVMQRDV